MREVLEIRKLTGYWYGDIPPIVVEDFVSKKEIRRLAIREIVKTGYGSGKYGVYDQNQKLIIDFYFDRWYK